MPTSTFFNLPDSKRQIILDIAIDEFAGNDYDVASISRVVERAGIAKGSFYQYFADKRDLYYYLLELAATEKNSFFQSHPLEPGEDLFAYIRHLFRVGLRFEFSHPGLARIAYRAVYGGGPELEDAAARLRQNSAAFFRDMITKAQATGRVDPALDAELVAFLLNQVFTGFGDFLLGRLELDPATLASGGAAGMDKPEYWRDIDQLLSILQRGLRPPSD